MTETTMRFGNKEYRFVPDRLKQFREENPNADIQTESKFHPDGSLTFKARIIRDQSDPYSAKGTGQAHYSAEEMKPKKSFEKLETIAKGRALADIGYLNDGQIATTEELQEFYEQRNTKVEAAIALLESAKSMEELKDSFMKLGTLMKNKAVIEAKDKMKAKLSKVAV